jgi:peroxiredoxin
MSGTRGLERRLVGMRAPAVELPWALEAKTSLAVLASRRSLVVFFYAGVKAKTGREEIDANVDTARAWAWRDHDHELETLGYMLVGVSTQSSSTQAQWASDELLGYMLLSDGELELAGVLGLPTMQAAGERVYEPLTLIVQDGRIARVFYPVDPAHEAESVTDWIAAERCNRRQR